MLFCIVTFNLWLHFNYLLTYLLTYLLLKLTTDRHGHTKHRAASLYLVFKIFKQVVM